MFRVVALGAYMCGSLNCDARWRSWCGAVTGWASAGHPDSCRRDNGMIDPEVLLLTDCPTPTAPHGGVLNNPPGTVVCTVRHVTVAHH